MHECNTRGTVSIVKEDLYLGRTMDVIDRNHNVLSGINLVVPGKNVRNLSSSNQDLPENKAISVVQQYKRDELDCLQEDEGRDALTRLYIE